MVLLALFQAESALRVYITCFANKRLFFAPAYRLITTIIQSLNDLKNALWSRGLKKNALIEPQSSYSYATIKIKSQYNHTTIMLQSRYDYAKITLQSRHNHATIMPQPRHYHAANTPQPRHYHATIKPQSCYNPAKNTQ